MKAKYLVSEVVDEDGGFGDRVETLVPLAVFGNRPDAETYVRKYSNEQCYAIEFDDLYFGELTIQEVISNPSINTDVKELPNYDDRSRKH